MYGEFCGRVVNLFAVVAGMMTLARARSRAAVALSEGPFVDMSLQQVCAIRSQVGSNTATATLA